MQGRTTIISRRGLLLSAASAFPAIRILRAQKQESAASSSDTTFSTNVKVVNVLATVRNGKGDLVRNLTVSDFTLEEDGRPQNISYFAKETNLPLTLGLLVDTSGSQRRVLDQEKAASRDFFQHVMRDGTDQAFLIHFDREVELLQDVTSSRDKLQAALGTMDRPQLRRPGDPDPNDNGQTDPSGGGNRGGGYPGGGGGRYPGGGYPGGGGQGGGRRRGFGGGTQLYDSVLLASDELMRKQTGRKALIVLSDGVDNGSKTSLNSAIESAQRADTMVYAVMFSDEEAYGGGQRGGFGGPGIGIGGGGIGVGRRGGGRRGPAPEQRPDGKKILERLSKETGGAFFEGSKKHSLSEIYDRIEEELRNQYSLGYTSDHAEGSGYRKIKLTAKQKGLVVQARDGYYPI
jgi:VWFA-related protein